jgi:quercetin dioxygenase-like cupin family protein
MKAFQAVLASAFVLSWSGATLAQDPLKVDATHYKVILENASVRVLKVDYPAGGKSVMHQHPDAIAVALGPAKVQFNLPDGKSQTQEMPADTATYMPGGTHNPTNIGSTAVNVILVEFKGAAPGKATIPTTRDGLAIKPLAEGPRAVAQRVTMDAKFNEPAGSKHDYDQVVIALGPGQTSLAIDGKPAKTTWSRGDVSFIGRGTAHETKSGGKPMDLVLIAIR